MRGGIPVKKMNRSLICGLAMLLLVSVPVVVSFFWQPYDVNVMDYGAVFEKPSIRHIFGTDNFGRDIFTRVVEGIRSTFAIAVFTVLSGAVIGTLAGALTGYYGGIADEILMRVNDCLASFPSILLALVIVSILDKGTLNICIALGIVFIPSFARIMRAEFMAEKSRDYVANAKLMGAGDLRIIFIHIFPNTLPVLISALLVGLNNAVLAEAGLSYLGLGVQPPDPSLGRMLSEAQVYIWGAPWYVISTCAVMVLAILGITLVSENIGVSGINFKHVRKKAEERRKQLLANSSKQSEPNPANGEQIDSRRANPTEPGRKASNVKKPPVIRINDLHMGFIGENGISDVLKGINLELEAGEILGIVGESGSGKSMTAMSIMGILPETGCITKGEIYYRGMPLVGLDERKYCKIRGSRIAMIFQEPMTSLNPVQTIGEQIDEVLDLHTPELSAGQQRERELAAMADTGLKEPEKVYNMYPHELSGGMRQRVMIAMALVAKADVIIADEPTTALDADIAGKILDIFTEINRKYKTTIILISHDLEVIEKVCSRTVILKEGRIVEELGIKDGFAKPESEYGKRLLEAAFADRSYVKSNIPEKDEQPLVRLIDYSVGYMNRHEGLFGRKYLKTINKDVNLEIYRGDCLGIVGESGSGKTTLVKAIAGLQKYTSGVLELNCACPAMVFQDPMSSLNPAMTVGGILEEPLKIAGVREKQARHERVAQILEAVELEPEYSSRRISELSGGQRQRVAIALTLVLKKELIILDEPVSALDVTIREQIVELLMKLKEQYNLTFIIISHDKRLIERICNRVYTVEQKGT